MPKIVSIMTEGSVEDRVRVVLECLYNGDILQTHPKWGGILIKADDTTRWIVIPQDVMEYMIERDLITSQELHS